MVIDQQIVFFVFSQLDDVMTHSQVTAFEGSHITLRCPLSMSEGTHEIYWIDHLGDRIDQTKISNQ